MEFVSAGGGVGVSDDVEKKDMEGEPKVKRKMKTPSQLEILEKTYAAESYPSEALRTELSVKLGLSDRQLQMWFCHRRLKDRKPATEKRPRKTVSPSVVRATSGGCADELKAINADLTKEEFSSGLSLFGNVDSFQRQQRVVHKVGTAVPRISTELPLMRRFYEPPLAVSEQRAIAFVEAQLGEPLRENGPILGMEFDPLPPGAFGAPIGQHKPAGWPCDLQLNERLDIMPIKGSSQALHEYQFLPEKSHARNDVYEKALPPHLYGSPSDIRNARVPLPTGKSSTHNNEQVHSGYGLQVHMPSFSLLPQQGRHSLHLSPASGDVDIVPRIAPIADVHIDAHYVHPKTGLDNQIVTPDRVIIHDEMKMERKRKTEEARIAKEVRAHDKRIRKELEKQNILRRKRDEQMRKEIERKDRERRKEEERVLREKQREEERHRREQRREMERREKFLQKEYIRAEKMRLKEELRREKEAVRFKAANNRAAARRIAKESMDLIDDERLELMELAASSKGLPSILALDDDTLQNLDSLKDKLPGFPPKSVHLKKPFGVQPWTDSDENVGNLIMVWRFLITFADVLGLWPFTLDEFTQAFNDFDSRLLGEIHVALLRSIMKDIEDVARTPATAPATNQSSAINPGGGHLQIVEGAYAWGFDLLSWQRHLSPLTWPEVLRQFALSAGFGPKLKRKVEPGYAHDANEVDDGSEIISNLRSGLAVENAVALMQERGLSKPRRSRHRLTPGTVKFAAFHILSLVGSKGLSILEVANKIQKSGLRDLTTSKTPEASISAALSRDTKLFERTAPSTYCVRSPYRKDPVDAESILAAAREKIRVYQNGITEGDDAEDVEKEDAEQDQDSDSEVAEDPDADDLDSELKLKENSYSSEKLNLRNKNFSHHGKESLSVFRDTPSVSHGIIQGDSVLSHCFGDIKCNGGSLYDVAAAHPNSISDQDTAVIDEYDSLESWVQGLTEGEYTDLSIEERLNALIALVGVVNEGNAIRLALEERLESANALKKQMWAEAQLDKRRVKDEQVLRLQHSSFVVNRADQIYSQSAVEDRKSPLGDIDMRNEMSSSNRKFLLVDLNDQQNEQNSCNDASTQEYPMFSDALLLQQSVYAAEKSRKELKAFISHRAEEMYVYRSLPLGLDRRFNRYWQLITSPSPNDPCSGRIFVEFFNGVWRLIDSEEDFNALLSSLDVRGTRECHLHSMLLKVESSFKATARTNLSRATSVKHVSDEVDEEILQMRPKLDCYPSTDSSKRFEFASYSNSPGNELQFPIEFGKNREKENDMIESYYDFEKWMMDGCLNSKLLAAHRYGRLRRQQLSDICKHCHELFSCDDTQCPSCHGTCSVSERTFDFLEHITDCKRKPIEGFGRVLHKLSFPLQIRLLKALLTTIEASIPPEAFKSVWSDENRKLWGMKLHLSSSPAELLETLTLLENSIERSFLSASNKATCELLSSSNHIEHSADSFSRPGAISVLSWIPHTTPAVALRLMELDSSIYYTPQQKEACLEDNGAGYYTKFPSRVGSLIDNVSRAGYLQHDYWLDLVSGHTSLKRGRGRPRGPNRNSGKSQRKTYYCRGDQCHVTIGRSENFSELTGWRGRPSGCKKGRRSVRNRQKPARRVRENVGEKSVSLDQVSETPCIRKEEWDLEETPIEAEGGENGSSSSEQSDFDYLNVQASADEYNGILVDLPDVGSVDYHRVDVEDDQHVDIGNRDNMDEDDDDVEDFEQSDYNINGEFDEQYNDEENQSRGAEQVGNVDRSRGSSSSSDYSF
ncbi:homeobox-DDT domain protein RLT2-like isoform X2 [Primulina eburnea]|uniref:homeobox-DDT domain protein RLT2-like isoform X2 n=1 Tax=Primulina eburnea TaxID=1245227 RepID=UPI003C6C11B4